MEIIDLSQPLYDGMEVYPGDPEVHIKQIHTLDKEGWRLKYLQFSTHIGTHADALAHMDNKGITIDKLPLNRFFGKTVLVKPNNTFPKEVGLAFRDDVLGLNVFKKIVEAKPLFVIVGDKSDFELEMERKLLRAGILTMAGLVNMDKLPSNKPFMFYGVPLKIKDGDGSPIRAFATIE
ncbi:cyclase [candidate division WWE3 bacterium CG08_land_8_20_14_0_20_41_10]|uniref:Cyclase n=1 Tax=candidate division WWE3 bacterium CG08_land_8_20_14_0_20_41_10 TaxID=1975085 RepID=A0A2H0XDG8_UNCKA|nr:MAG: cyclase [candidate division WWE3 bacterium CG08_land_8_20_14_0_20_41_10]